MPRRRPAFACAWTLLSPRLDAHGGAEHSRRLLAGLTGRVLEVGAGDGRNLRHFPGSVDDIVTVEPQRRLRERIAARVDEAPAPVTVLDGAAESLPLEDDAVDAVVCCLALCSVDELDAALAEVRRVLRPGGRLRFFEHVAAHGGAHLRLQRALDATIWPRLGGCHTARDTLGAIQRAELAPTWLERLRFPDAPVPTSPHLLGEAVAPS